MENPEIIKIDNKGKKISDEKVKQSVRKIDIVKTNANKTTSTKNKKKVNKNKTNNKKKALKQKINKKNYIMTFGFVLSVLLISTGLTFAYFTSIVTGNENASSTVIETADLRLIFTDTTVLTMDGALPGRSESKTFTVENKGNMEVEYTINIKDLLNEFVNDELVYSLTSDNGGATADREPLPTGSEGESLLQTATIAPGVVQTYTITILFLETGENQNSNQGALFSGTLQINVINKYTVVGGWYDDCSESSESLSCNIITKEEAISDEVVDFTYNSSGVTGCLWDGSSVSNCQTNSTKVTNGLYYTSNETVLTDGEDAKRIYYYRGNIDNNWVSFAGSLWRIVRTTAEGGVKLAYSGDAASDTSAFVALAPFNSSLAMDSKYYVGYTHNSDLSGYTGEQTDSAVKAVVDAWYNGGTTSGTECDGSACDFTGLSITVSEYEDYLSTTAIFCNDKSSERVDGSYTDFPGYIRVWESQRPTFACLSTNASRYTVSENVGNGYLDYPVGLLTMDELMYAGLSDVNFTKDSYIMDNIATYFWTMTPASVSEGDVTVFFGHEEGGVIGTSTVATIAVRPSVALKSCVTVTDGDGSFSYPYELSNSKC